MEITVGSITGRRLLHLAGGAAALPAFSRAAMAQACPAKPVNIVVPFGPGTGNDAVTRVIAQPLSLALRQSILVENKPGANRAIAATQVARSTPDGYTLLMRTNRMSKGGPARFMRLVGMMSGWNGELMYPVKRSWS